LGQLRRVNDYSLLKLDRLEKSFSNEEFDRFREVKLGNSSYRGLIDVIFEFMIAKSFIECCYCCVPVNTCLQSFEFKG
jgi:hypothetical protein